VREDEQGKPVNRIWVPQVAVDVEFVGTRCDVAVARGLDAVGVAVVTGVRRHLDRAEAAAFRRDPLPGRLANWWRGVLVEAAYRHLHAAETQVVELYDEVELRAEIRSTVARGRAALHREDLRLWTVEELEARPPGELRFHLRRLMQDSFAALDARHGQLRSFRNTLLMASLLISLLVTATIVVVWLAPNVMPLCFPREVVVAVGPPVTTRQMGLNCPTGFSPAGPYRGDVLVVALLGLLGGALAAAISIRNLKGTVAPYDVPVAPATLKVPLGAFTAVLALVAIRADFVPGLSSLDSQEQILAYALVFGFAQQLLTRLLDQRAQVLLDGLPSKDTATDLPPAPPHPSPAARAPAPAGGGHLEPAARPAT
jgi:hypothetical protein